MDVITEILFEDEKTFVLSILVDGQEFGGRAQMYGKSNQFESIEKQIEMIVQQIRESLS